MGNDSRAAGTYTRDREGDVPRHFFFDKMEKVELEPLKPKQMVEAYRKRFKGIEPFTEDALLALGRMSRGIFRRFLRYITLTLQYSEPG